MIYRIYKEKGRIGTGLEKMDVSYANMPDIPGVTENQTSLAIFDNETNTIHVLNDQMLDIISLVQKIKNYCDLPNKHEFIILHQ